PRSSVSYGTTSTTGTSSSVSSSFKAGYQISVDASAFDSGPSATFSTSQERTNTSEIDITKSSSYTINAPGPSQDGIDHDQDRIWLILNPVVELSVTGKNVAWAVTVAGQNTEIQYVTVGWLKNPSSMPRGVATSLRNAGITPADYPTLLAR